jgi:hypothetical protein
MVYAVRQGVKYPSARKFIVELTKAIRGGRKTPLVSFNLHKKGKKAMIQKLRNAHPAICLECVYTYANVINRKIMRDVVFTRSMLMSVMGFQDRSGAGHNVAGALVHFGMLKHVDEGYIMPAQIQDLLTRNMYSYE